MAMILIPFITVDVESPEYPIASLSLADYF